MNVLLTKLEGVLIIEPKVHGDIRGYFVETYNHEVFSQHGLKYEFVQDNQSFSQPAGTLRGLHYQLAPKAQTKLVRAIAGAIYDVVVDIRKGSSTFGEWISVILSGANQRQLLVPKGFAHGFCTIVENTLVAYKVDEFYSPEHDRGIAWNDSDLGIDWPTSIPILSKKDEQHPPLRRAEI